MKKRNITSAIALSALLTLLIACKFGAGNSNFTSETDKFSVAFPLGSSDVKTETTDRKYAKASREYSKTYDNKTPDFRNYSVEVLELEPAQVAGKSTRQIQEIALNGWEKEPDTIIAPDIKFKGATGLDSSYNISIDGITMWFRQAVFYSEEDLKLYVVRISASKKEKIIFNDEATAFMNSFRFSKGWF